MTDDSRLAELLALLKVLADESRLRLLGLLAQAPTSVEALAAALALKEPTVSHHLARLKSAGLVSMTQDGTRHLYALDAEALRRLSRDLFASVAAADSAPESAEAAWEEKVLATYLRDGKLTELPASRRKRRVVLAQIARNFADGEVLPEKELNARLAEVHPDTATLRREFIGYRMMTRDAGIYTRLPETQWRSEAEQHRAPAGTAA
ncbi:DUF2087 domain-containing protein [Frigidibacter sp. ROC022]|uniref:DUF2087 domain-containing protein n=1 Tax=Frigidibacter sp. ROC022 TaxID=2971796 RepID=UPI00215A57A2|nr:metalloregulator ArsR/SmtB family transcription factor [Frigidibacter sp. ROC022]MCR8725455.1 metalloregulator ArsR/SmtB family transcription factor [Frigidibacter sp. ROC022]